MMRNFSRAWLCIIAILWISPVYAQNINFQFKELAINEGLSHTDATDIVQDDQGFIWIASYGGLNRFDGYEVKTFINNQEQVRKAFNNRINQLDIDEHGLVWLATQGGLKVFSTELEEFLPLNGLENYDELFSDLRSVFIYDKATLFFSSVSNKTYGFRIVINKEGILLQKIFEAENNFVSAQRDLKGNVWFGSNQNLNFLDCTGDPDNWKLRNFQVESEQLERTSINPTTIIIDRNDRLVGNMPGAIFFVDLNDFYRNPDLREHDVLSIDYNILDIDNLRASNHIPEGVSFNIQSIVENVNEGYWIATNYGLILAKDEGGDSPIYQAYFHNDYDKNSITSNEINSLFIDNSQCLWLTTWGGGVNYFDLNQKRFYMLTQKLDNPENTMSGKYVRAILEDEIGNIWIGTRAHGLNYYDFKKNKFTHYTYIENTSNTIISDQVRSLVMDREKRLWIGTTDGISVFDTKNGTFDNISAGLGEEGQLSGAQIFGLAIDKFGQIWAGSWLFGLNRISYHGYADYEIEQIYQGSGASYQLSDNNITFIFADPDNPEVFVSTKNGGLNRIFLNDSGEINRLKVYRGQEGDQNKLSSDFIWPILKSDEKTIWVGSLGGGLNKITLDDATDNSYQAQSFGINQGAPSNDIESILIDDHGKLWLGGKGLSRFDPETNSFMNFDVRDGLQGNSFKIGSAYKGKSGRLYFGGTEGITYFYPDKITQNDRTPNVVLTELEINNEIIEPGSKFKKQAILERAIQQTEKIVLHHELNNIAIKFASLHYANPNRIKYRYKLEGYDNMEIETNADQRIATYSNLGYGDYTFYVTATNNDGFWSDDPVRLNITIVTPWWDTTLLKSLYVLIGILFLIGIYLFQSRWFRLKKNLEITLLEEKKMEEMHQMRLQFFTNISHEFRTPLTLILSPLEKLMNETMDTFQQRKYFKMIHQNSKRLLGLINELMDFRKVETGSIKLQVSKNSINDFIIESTQNFEEHALSRDIHFMIKTNGKLGDIWFDKELVYKVLTNLLSNSFKYSKNGGVVKVELLADDDRFVPSFANEFIIENEEGIKDLWWIRIFDTGVGISSESIDHVFKRYYRISDSDKDQHLGSGIGLALVRSLVLLHKGKIKVYSERDKGSEFVVGFPLGKKYFSVDEISYADQVTINHQTVEINGEIVEPLTADDHEDLKPATKTKILIVEDNVEMRQFLKESFEDEYTVFEADDGEVGLKQARENLPDLIISDVMMPVMDGIEFCQKVKEDIEISHIPFIMLTAKSNIENRIEGAESGADAYFSKPFSLKLLKISVQNMLASRERLKQIYQNDVFAEARELVNSQKEKEFVDQLISIIEENITIADFDVEHLSREVGISRTKLYNKVKAITGQSVGEFIRKLRMKKAAKILMSEDVTILEVIDRVGIKSQSHFTKAFKKEFGQTPSQFITQHEKEHLKA